MTLKVSELNKPTKKVDNGRLEDGNHLARIVSVIDLGLQEQTDWQTKEKVDPKKIVMITYETPDELITYKDKEGNEVTKPRWISKDYTLSMHEMAALRKLVDALKPDLNYIHELLNVPCMINIGSTATGNAKVVGVSKPMKGMEVKDLYGDAFHFDFGEPNMELFNGLLKWQQEKIKSALDYNGFADGDSSKPVADDDIPF